MKKLEIIKKFREDNNKQDNNKYERLLGLEGEEIEGQLLELKVRNPQFQTKEDKEATSKLDQSSGLAQSNSYLKVVFF